VYRRALDRLLGPRPELEIRQEQGERGDQPPVMKNGTLRVLSFDLLLTSM
jgi:hypothetical protein